MSMMVSFVLSFFPRDVLDEILNLIESVSEDFPSYSCLFGTEYVITFSCNGKSATDFMGDHSLLCEYKHPKIFY